MKTIEITTGLFAEDMTIKSALKKYKAEREGYYRQQKLIFSDGFFPNQHIIKADINNCKSLLKKLI